MSLTHRKRFNDRIENIQKEVTTTLKINDYIWLSDKVIEQEIALTYANELILLLSDTITKEELVFLALSSNENLRDFATESIKRREELEQ